MVIGNGKEDEPGWRASGFLALARLRKLDESQVPEVRGVLLLVAAVVKKWYQQ